MRLQFSLLSGGAGRRKAPPRKTFFLGKASQERIRSQGMHEDAARMKGPDELIRDGLSGRRPDRTIPNRVLVLDRPQLTANGEADVAALAAAGRLRSADRGRPCVVTIAAAQGWPAEAWAKALRADRVFGLRPPLRVVFEPPGSPTSPPASRTAARPAAHRGHRPPGVLPAGPRRLPEETRPFSGKPGARRQRR